MCRQTALRHRSTGHRPGPLRLPAAGPSPWPFGGGSGVLPPGASSPGCPVLASRAPFGSLAPLLGGFSSVSTGGSQHCGDTAESRVPAPAPPVPPAPQASVPTASRAPQRAADGCLRAGPGPPACCSCSPCPAIRHSFQPCGPRDRSPSRLCLQTRPRSFQECPKPPHAPGCALQP